MLVLKVQRAARRGTAATIRCQLAAMLHTSPIRAIAAASQCPAVTSGSVRKQFVDDSPHERRGYGLTGRLCGVETGDCDQVVGVGHTHSCQCACGAGPASALTPANLLATALRPWRYGIDDVDLRSIENDQSDERHSVDLVAKCQQGSGSLVAYVLVELVMPTHLTLE